MHGPEHRGFSDWKFSLDSFEDLSQKQVHQEHVSNTVAAKTEDLAQDWELHKALTVTTSGWGPFSRFTPHRKISAMRKLLHRRQLGFVWGLLTRHWEEAAPLPQLYNGGNNSVDITGWWED